MKWTRHSEVYYEVEVCEEKVKQLENIGFTIEIRDHVEKYGTNWARVYMQVNEFYCKHKSIAHY